MIKQQERVIRKGDYYEMETYEETMMYMSKSKKQETQNPTSSTNIPSSDYILVNVPTFSEARDKYISSNFKQQYSMKNISQLRDQLQLLANQDDINDEDRNEIEKLLEEIDQFRDSKELPLNELSKPKDASQTQAKEASYNKINLTAQYNIKRIQQKILSLQTLDFPDLLNLQHQLQIMVGQKKPLQNMQLPQMDEKQKEEFNNLYNHLNSLSILNNTQTTIESISMNEEKHVEMQSWVEKIKKVQGLNNDFLMELKRDSELVEKLQKNFVENVKEVRQILAQIRK